MEGAGVVGLIYPATGFFIGAVMGAITLKKFGVWISAAIVLSFIFIVLIVLPIPPKGLYWSVEANKQLVEIIKAEEAYHLKHGEYVSLKVFPESLDGKAKEWNPNADIAMGYKRINWFPGNKTFCQYGVSVSNSKKSYMVEIQCDFGKNSHYGGSIGYVKKLDADEKLVPPIGRCSQSGVYVSEAERRLNSIGPCDKTSQRGMGIRAY